MKLLQTMKKRKELLSKISELGLSKQSYDEYNITKKDLAVLDNAKKLINVLEKHMLDMLDVKNIYFSKYGSIIMIFETKHGNVHIEIGDTSFSFFTDFENNSNYACEGMNFDFKTVPDNLKTILNK